MQQKPSTKEEYLKRINSLTEYINNNLGEDMDLGVLAEISGFSPWHFHRITRAFLNEPLWAYITRVRLGTAARLLRYSDMPVKDIAYRVGYDVPSSLSKAFRQQYGISPNEYRKNKTYVIMKPMKINPELKIDMRVINMNPLRIAYVRLTGFYGGLDYMGAWRRLYDYRKDNGLGKDPAEHICIYHDDPKVTEPEKLRTDVCVTVGGTQKPKGEVGIKTIKGGKYAVFTYVGPYSDLTSEPYTTLYTGITCRSPD